MQMWILKPPGFDAGKKYPLAFLVHGGPQGAWEDGWSFRWCPELWAAQGYVVALPNPRGSTGFGQKYVDEITGDWGGKCYDDLMKGLEYLEKQPYIDKRSHDRGRRVVRRLHDELVCRSDRQVQDDHQPLRRLGLRQHVCDDRRSLVRRMGARRTAMGQSTARVTRSTRRIDTLDNLGKFKTPMLLIQNDLDFRCPVGQGIELFTTLQRQGVPSRFINFPDEGHWVLEAGQQQALARRSVRLAQEIRTTRTEMSDDQ